MGAESVHGPPTVAGSRRRWVARAGPPSHRPGRSRDRAARSGPSAGASPAGSTFRASATGTALPVQKSNQSTRPSLAELWQDGPQSPRSRWSLWNPSPAARRSRGHGPAGNATMFRHDSGLCAVGKIPAYASANNRSLHRCAGGRLSPLCAGRATGEHSRGSTGRARGPKTSAALLAATRGGRSAGWPAGGAGQRPRVSSGARRPGLTAWRRQRRTERRDGSERRRSGSSRSWRWASPWPLRRLSQAGGGAVAAARQAEVGVHGPAVSSGAGRPRSAA